MSVNLRRLIIGFYITLVGTGLLLIPTLRFSFDFDQFFPKGDPELEFFNQFRKTFEADDSFLLIAFDNKQSVFDSVFLSKVHFFTLEAGKLPFVKQSTSVTNWVNPMRVLLGSETLITIPAIHIEEPDRYHRDSIRIMADERLIGNLIDKDASVLVVALSTADDMYLEESAVLMQAVDSLLEKTGLEKVHVLGRANFQRTLVNVQIREVILSTVVAIILVSGILIWIFRTFWGVFISLVSIGSGMAIFLGYMAILKMELSLMAALYPVLMIIVGTSDVVHILSKYIDELRNGKSRRQAVQVTVREIGLATLLTSLTTAIGFLTLITSKIVPIREFGFNAAAGVLIAYITVITLTVALMSAFRSEQLEKSGRLSGFWKRSTTRIHLITKVFAGRIVAISVFLIAMALFGISLISTNYKIESNLPIGAKVTEDFHFFEERLAGFRPFELAIIAKDTFKINDYDLLREINEIENRLWQEPMITTVVSPAVIQKSLRRAFNGDRPEAYTFPETREEFNRYENLIKRLPQGFAASQSLVSDDQKLGRISARIKDTGADSIRMQTEIIVNWINQERDTNLFGFHVTGTGVLIDRNSQYVRDSLIKGLGGAVLIVSFLMFLLFRNWRMVLISMVPNLVPLLFAGALIGFLGIELEAGIAIVFAIIFGIAVDDSIHFLAKYRLVTARGVPKERALLITARETGKAIILTSIILFFGFLILLFSASPPNVTVGLLISLTLLTAVVCDLMLLPILIRYLMPERTTGPVSRFFQYLSPRSISKDEFKE